MNNFYQEWKAYLNKYSVSHDVVCRVPLCGYFAWKNGEILRCEISYEIPVRGDRRMGSTWQPSKADMAALDFSTEKATCQLFAIPFCGLHSEEEIELMYGNGRGSFVAYRDSGLTPACS